MSGHQVICPYCQRPAKLVSLASVYPNDPKHEDGGNVWHCRPCGAWSPVASNGMPVAPLANRQLRRKRARILNRLGNLAPRDVDRAKVYQGIDRELKRESVMIGTLSKEDCDVVESFLTDLETSAAVARREGR